MRKLFKNATILTLDKKLGNYENADLLVNGSTIEAIGPNLNADNCEVIDASNRIIMQDLLTRTDIRGNRLFEILALTGRYRRI